MIEISLKENHFDSTFNFQHLKFGPFVGPSVRRWNRNDGEPEIEISQQGVPIVPALIGEVEGKKALNAGIQKHGVLRHRKGLPNFEFPVGPQKPGVETRVKNVG